MTKITDELLMSFLLTFCQRWNQTVHSKIFHPILSRIQWRNAWNYNKFLYTVILLKWKFNSTSTCIQMKYRKIAFKRKVMYLEVMIGSDWEKMTEVKWKFSWFVRAIFILSWRFTLQSILAENDFISYDDNLLTCNRLYGWFLLLPC